MSVLFQNAPEDDRPAKRGRKLTPEEEAEKRQFEQAMRRHGEFIKRAINEDRSQNSFNTLNHIVESGDKIKIHDKRPKILYFNEELTPALRRTAIEYIWSWCSDQVVDYIFVENVFHDTVINFDRYFSVVKLEGENDEERTQTLKHIIMTSFSLASKYHKKIFYDDIESDPYEGPGVGVAGPKYLQPYLDVVNSEVEYDVLAALHFELSQTNVYDLLEQTLYYFKDDDTLQVLRDKRVRQRMVTRARLTLYLYDMYEIALEDIVATIILVELESFDEEFNPKPYIFPTMNLQKVMTCREMFFTIETMHLLNRAHEQINVLQKNKPKTVIQELKKMVDENVNTPYFVSRVNELILDGSKEKILSLKRSWYDKWSELTKKI